MYSACRTRVLMYSPCRTLVLMYSACRTRVLVACLRAAVAAFHLLLATPADDIAPRSSPMLQFPRLELLALHSGVITTLLPMVCYAVCIASFLVAFRTQTVLLTYRADLYQRLFYIR